MRRLRAARVVLGSLLLTPPVTTLRPSSLGVSKVRDCAPHPAGWSRPRRPSHRQRQSKVCSTTLSALRLRCPFGPSGGPPRPARFPGAVRYVQRGATPLRTPLASFLTTSAARSSVCPAGLLHPAADPRVVLVLAPLASPTPCPRRSTACPWPPVPGAPPPVPCTLQSLPPTHSLPRCAGAEPPHAFSPGLTVRRVADGYRPPSSRSRPALPSRRFPTVFSVPRLHRPFRVGGRRLRPSIGATSRPCSMCRSVAT